MLIKCLSILLLLSIFTTNVMAERPKVILTFDDGKVSVFNKAFPIMEANNQVGVVFIITGEVTNNPVPDVGSFMNLSQISALYDSSWDLSSHTVTHPHLTQITSTKLNYELSASKAFLDSAGFTRGSMFFAYPYGEYNANVISALKSGIVLI
jgi:peptidoglycan/xylan/chitin deacetylase (PgdA/CDA1 family)